MADPREAIMARLLVVIGTAIGVTNVSRNELFSDDAEGARRWVSLLEGDEIAAEEQALNRPAGAGRIIYMQPGVLLSNFDASAVVGTGLSVSRAAIIKAVAADSQLNALTHKGTGGRFIGMQNEPAFASNTLVRMTLKFHFAYELIPSLL